MTKENISCFLSGEHTHIDPEKVLSECSWSITGKRVRSAPQTIFKILNHMIFWQDIYLDRMEGRMVASPEKPSAGWPEPPAPADENEWVEAVAVFQQGLAVAREVLGARDLEERIPAFRNDTLGECLVYLALHNSHHIGQIITLRQALGDWPEIKDQW